MSLNQRNYTLAPNCASRKGNMKGGKPEKEPPKKMTFEEHMAQLDFEDRVFKAVIALLPKGKGLADSRWADPGTKPLQIAPNNILGLRTDYIHNPIPSSEPSIDPETENVNPCDISPTVSTTAKSTSHHIKVKTLSPPSTSMNSFSLEYTKMPGYVPPHLKGLTGGQPENSTLPKYVSSSVGSSLSSNPVAIRKTDDRAILHEKASSANNSRAFGNSPSGLNDTSSAIVNATSNKHAPSHSRSPRDDDPVKTSKNTGTESSLMISQAKLATSPKPASYIPPHLQAIKPTESYSSSPLTIKGEHRGSNSPNASATTTLGGVDNAPHHFRPQPDLGKAFRDSKMNDASREGKPMTLSPISERASNRNNSAHPPNLTSMTTCKATSAAQTATPKPRFKLACSWEEFARGKETINFQHSAAQNSGALVLNTTDNTDTAFNMSKDVPERQNPPVNRHPTNHTSPESQTGQLTGRESAKQDNQSVANIPVEAQIADVLDTDPPGENMKSRLLTRNALIKVLGSAPPEYAVSGIEQAVSDDGIAENSQFQYKTASQHDTEGTGRESGVPNSRGYLASQQINVQGLNGSRAQIPCNWERGRDDNCSVYIPDYIAKWLEDIEDDGQQVDVTAEEFTTGVSPLCNKKFLAPVQQPLSFPDINQSENVYKQRLQHAELDCNNYLRRQIQKKRIETRAALLETQRTEEIKQAYENAEPEPNPYSPKIPIYLRPAEERDVPGITEIYNYYVMNSIIPEDQAPVDERDIRVLLHDVCSDHHPFIVAILGAAPKDTSIHSKKFSSRYPTTKSVTQSEERVVGFTYINAYYGVASTSRGRSRHTGNLQFYVHHQYTRKGIGRCLVDRILLCTCATHCSKGGYDWVEPKDSFGARIYGDSRSGPRIYHQLLIERPIERECDPDYEWFKRWLHQRFFFTEAARFLATARSRVPDKCRWLDLLYFQKSATLDAEIMD